MKKILSLSSAHILLFCGVGLALTLGSFWHHQSNQAQLERMNNLNQGVSTCFNRISQTFTAMMIKDIQSSYLNRGFMGLSDECLNETIKGINPFRQNAGRGYETLNKLISEVHWLHESILKIHAPMLAGQNLNPSLAPLSDKFSKMESYKVDLLDEVDAVNAQLKNIQANDELLMGAGLLMFVISLSLLSLQEFNRIQIRREIEKDALNLLKSGQANVGAIVDQLIDRALMNNALPVSAQIFRDYHGELLERVSVRVPAAKKADSRAPAVVAEETEEVVATPDAARASLKEALVSLQNVHSKNVIQLSEIRDVTLAVNHENLEQMLNASVNKLADRRTDNKKIMISNQIHSDKSIINLFLAGTTFSAAELEYSSNPKSVSAEGVDMNMIILKEMASEAGAAWHLENKADRSGNITGMNIRLVLNRSSKEKNSKNLVSVVRGKKRDITREFMN